MPTYINHIVTGVPKFSYDQNFVRDFLKSNLDLDRMTSLAIHQVYRNSGIQKRYSAIPDFSPDNTVSGHFYDPESKSLKNPGTGARNAMYEVAAKELFKDLAERLIIESGISDRSKVTHVITVSCTGFYAPGPDLDIVKHCGLDPSTQRIHIGFMGCYAAFPAFRLAKAICGSDPNAVVLIASVELCTLHLKFQTDTDSIISTSVFADGGAAALITTDRSYTGLSGYEIGDLFTTVTTKGEKDMAWTIGDHGFDMILSTYIPDLLSSNIREVLAPLFRRYAAQITDVDLWAIHPGGRAIIDKLVQELEISEHQVTPSREILSEYGNMSSATILFVLDRMRTLASNSEQKVLAMAFGPGLTVESGMFTLFKAD
mgnify:FL=1